MRCSKEVNSAFTGTSSDAPTENLEAQTVEENFFKGRHLMTGSNSLTNATTDGDSLGGLTSTPEAKFSSIIQLEGKISLSDRIRRHNHCQIEIGRPLLGSITL